MVKSIRTFTHTLSFLDKHLFSRLSRYIYINWGNTSLFIVPGTLPTLKLPMKIHLSSRQQFFSDVVLVLNDHGCKRRAKKLIIISYNIYYIYYVYIYYTCIYILHIQIYVNISIYRLHIYIYIYKTVKSHDIEKI